MRRRDFMLTAAGVAAAPAFLSAQSAHAAAPAMPAFPKDFVWGASTSAYQIEGAAKEDGRGPSIWDVFSHQPGRIATGETGDIACDHYHRYAEDVDLLSDGGFGAYRFSIAWPRILPAGKGEVNKKGLDFYDRLIDCLLAKKVAPWACLYHWDLPQALQDRGGWTNRDTAGWFAEYANVVAARLADRVKHWAMLNEPNVHAIFGHAVGNHAPGLTGWANYAAAQHHQNLAQGRAIEALRASHPGLQLGTVISLQPVLPSTGREEDHQAAKRFDALWNRVNLDPLFKARYPEIFADSFAPLVKEGDLRTIHQKIDFLGVNYYGRAHIVDSPGSVLQNATFGPLPAGTPTTAMGWPVEPDGLVDVLEDLKSQYGNPPVYVMENGACYDDPAPQGGRVADPQRLAFLREHILAANRAIAQGCALRGYMAWSLLDNFEWAEGMRRRFGLVYVDFATQKRIPKDSFHWLSQVITRKA